MYLRLALTERSVVVKIRLVFGGISETTQLEHAYFQRIISEVVQSKSEESNSDESVRRKHYEKLVVEKS